jgi:hypothetical protein
MPNDPYAFAYGSGTPATNIPNTPTPQPTSSGGGGSSGGSSSGNRTYYIGAGGTTWTSEEQARASYGTTNGVYNLQGEIETTSKSQKVSGNYTDRNTYTSPLGSGEDYYINRQQDINKSISDYNKNLQAKAEAEARKGTIEYLQPYNEKGEALGYSKLTPSLIKEYSLYQTPQRQPAQVSKLSEQELKGLKNNNAPLNNTFNTYKAATKEKEGLGKLFDTLTLKNQLGQNLFNVGKEKAGQIAQPITYLGGRIIKEDIAPNFENTLMVIPIGGLFVKGVSKGSLALKGLVASKLTPLTGQIAKTAPYYSDKALGIIIPAATFGAIGMGTQEVLTRTAPSRISGGDFLKTAEGQGAIRTIKEAQNEAVKGNFWKSAANQIGIVNIFTQDKKVIEEAGTNYFLNLGQSPTVASSKAKALVEYDIQTKQAQALGVVLTSVGSEVGASYNLAKSFARTTTPQTGWNLFKRSAVNIAPFGFTEGTITQLQQQQQERKPFNFNEALAMGGYGALSAGILGGLIVGSSANKGWQRVFLGMGYIGDITEYPSDKIAALGIKGFEKASGKVFPQPTIKIPFSKVPTMTVGSTTNINPFTQTTTQTPEKKIKTIPTFAFSDIFAESYTKSTTREGTISFTPTRTSTNVNINPLTNINNNPFTQTDTNVNVNVNAPTNINSLINVPTLTPVLRIPPPIPLSLGTGGSGKGKKEGRKTYANELAAGLNIFNEFTGANIFGNNKQRGFLNIPIKRKKKK